MARLCFVGLLLFSATQAFAAGRNFTVMFNEDTYRVSSPTNLFASNILASAEIYWVKGPSGVLTLFAAPGIITNHTEKASPVAGDTLLVVDSEDGGALKMVQVGNLPGGGGGEANLGTTIGSGARIFAGKTGVTLQFVAATNTTGRMSIVTNGNQILFDVVEAGLDIANLGGTLASTDLSDTDDLARITDLTTSSNALRTLFLASDITTSNALITLINTKVDTNAVSALGTNWITNVEDIGAPAAGDMIPIVDISTATRKYVTASQLTGAGGSGTVTHTAGALTLDQPLLGAGGDDIKTSTVANFLSVLSVPTHAQLNTASNLLQTTKQPLDANLTSLSLIAPEFASEMIYWDGLDFAMTAAGNNGEIMMLSGTEPIWTELSGVPEFSDLDASVHTKQNGSTTLTNLSGTSAITNLSSLQFTNHGTVGTNYLRADQQFQDFELFHDFNGQNTTNGWAGTNTPSGHPVRLEGPDLTLTSTNLGRIENGLFVVDLVPSVPTGPTNGNVYLRTVVGQAPSIMGARFIHTTGDNGAIARVSSVTMATSSSTSPTTRMMHLRTERDGMVLSIVTNGFGNWIDMGVVNWTSLPTNNEPVTVEMAFLGDNWVSVSARGTNALFRHAWVDYVRGTNLYWQIGGAQSNLATRVMLDSIWTRNSAIKMPKFEATQFHLGTNGQGIYDWPVVHIATNGLDAAVIGSGTMAAARLGSGTANSSTFLRGDSTWATPSGSGDVVGPGSSQDNAVPRWNGTSGDTLQGSFTYISDLGGVTHSNAPGSATNLWQVLATNGTPAQPLVAVNSNGVFQTFGDGATSSTIELFEQAANGSSKWTITAAAALAADYTVTLADSGVLTAPSFSGIGTALTAINGENIQDDTIDDDSIDWSDVTIADLTGTQTSGAIAWDFSSATSFTVQDPIFLGVVNFEYQVQYPDSVVLSDADLGLFSDAHSIAVPEFAWYDATTTNLLLSYVYEPDGSLESGFVPEFRETFDRFHLVSKKDFRSVAGLVASRIVMTDANTNLTTPNVVTFPDNERQTFNPGADAAGLNVGSHAGDPGTPSNGDLWYDSTANELTARINGANVALGAGGAGGPTTSNNIPAAVTVFGTAPATNILINLSSGTLFRHVLTNNMGILLTNGVDGQEIIIELYQDATGNRTVTHVNNSTGASTNFWAFGSDITAPITLTTNALKMDRLKVIYNTGFAGAAHTTNRADVIGFVRGYPQ